MFKNRQQAGKLLGARLRELLTREPDYDLTALLVVGLPRGGVPVAKEVASALGANLTVLVSKKIGAPFQPELAIGAITSSGEVVLNEDLLQDIEDMGEYIESERKRLTKVTKELEEHWLRAAGIEEINKIQGKRVIIVDDGVATGMTTLAAIRSLRSLGAREILLAVPVISIDAGNRLSKECDQIISLLMPPEFQAVGQFYEDFHQVDDQEVVMVLKDFAQRAKVRTDKRS